MRVYSAGELDEIVRRHRDDWYRNGKKDCAFYAFVGFVVWIATVFAVLGMLP